MWSGSGRCLSIYPQSALATRVRKAGAARLATPVANSNSPGVGGPEISNSVLCPVICVALIGSAPALVAG